MSNELHRITVHIHYEDTDHSGVVYHPNYLKYFARAREAVLGADKLAELWKEKGIGYAVYKADVTFSEGVRYAEKLDIRSTFEIEGEYRIIWNQQAWRENGKKAAVTALIHLVCLNREGKLQKLPLLESLSESNT